MLSIKSKFGYMGRVQIILGLGPAFFFLVQGLELACNGVYYLFSKVKTDAANVFSIPESIFLFYYRSSFINGM